MIGYNITVSLFRKQVRSPEEVKSPRTSFKAGGNQQEAEMTQRGNRASWMRITSSYSITTVCSVCALRCQHVSAHRSAAEKQAALQRLSYVWWSIIIKQTCSQSATTVILIKQELKTKNLLDKIFSAEVHVFYQHREKARLLEQFLCCTQC